MPAFFAFLHHAAAFTLVAALALEFVSIREQLTLRGARRLQVADTMFGASAGVLLVVGLLRVVYFEKGAAYYFHNAYFIAKLSLFLLAALLSILPTVEFLRWSKAIKRGEVPAVAPARLRLLRRLIHVELACILAILACAALMAKGIGFFG